MKTLKPTREIKARLFDSFRRGHTPENVPGDLTQVPLEARERSFELWKLKQRKR